MNVNRIPSSGFGGIQIHSGLRKLVCCAEFSKKACGKLKINVLESRTQLPSRCCFEN